MEVMEITAGQVRELRQRTGVGIMDCKAALAEAKGDLAEAEKILRKKGLSRAAKKAGRATGEGVVGSYIHAGGKIGVLVEVNCETDFVARTEQFQGLVKELSLQIAASSPRYVSREEVSGAHLEAEKDIYRAQAAGTGKPDHIVEKIVEGRMEKFFEEVCLLEQPFVRDPERKVADLITETVAALGENIRVRRFARFAVGEADATADSEGAAQG
jgi:elongation factor Ts